jgi:hypothetical protein
VTDTLELPGDKYGWQLEDAVWDDDGAAKYNWQPDEVSWNDDDPGDWQPVSFTEKTASGKVKLRLADLVKVGPEGYIHGYICVRPPCGTKHEAVFSAKLGVVDHQDNGRIGRMRKNANGTYSMTHWSTGADGKITKTKLDAEYGSRADAAKSVALYHNVSLLHGQANATIQPPLTAARDALAAGDTDTATARLAEAEVAAHLDGNIPLETHIRDTRAAILSGPKPVNPPDLSGITYDAALPEPGLAPKAPPLPANVRQAAMNHLTPVLGWGKTSQATKDDVASARSAIDAGNGHAALKHLQDAYAHANADGNGMAMSHISGAHDAIASHLGEPLMWEHELTAPAAGEPDLQDTDFEPGENEDLAVADDDDADQAFLAELPKPASVPASVINDAKNSIANALNTKPGWLLANHLGVADAKLNSGNANGAFSILYQAHDEAESAGKDETAAHIAVAVNTLADELGKPGISSSIAPKPGTVPASMVNDAKNSIADALNAKPNAVSTSNLNSAMTALNDDDPEEALEWLNHAHDGAVANGDGKAAMHIAAAANGIASMLGKPKLSGLLAPSPAGDLNIDHDDDDNASAVQDLILNAKANTEDEDVFSHLNNASTAIDVGQAENAFPQLMSAHSAALEAGEDDVASTIEAAHDKLAEAHGTPSLQQSIDDYIASMLEKPPLSGSFASAGGDDHGSGYDGITVSHLIQDAKEDTGDSAVASLLSDAQQLIHSPTAAALPPLKSAHALALNAGENDVAAAIEAAHDKLAEAHGKPSLSLQDWLEGKPSTPAADSGSDWVGQLDGGVTAGPSVSPGTVNHAAYQAAVQSILDGTPPLENHEAHGLLQQAVSALSHPGGETKAHSLLNDAAALLHDNGETDLGDRVDVTAAALGAGAEKPSPAVISAAAPGAGTAAQKLPAPEAKPGSKVTAAKLKPGMTVSHWQENGGKPFTIASITSFTHVSGNKNYEVKTADGKTVYLMPNQKLTVHEPASTAADPLDGIKASVKPLSSSNLAVALDLSDAKVLLNQSSLSAALQTLHDAYDGANAVNDPEAPAILEAHNALAAHLGMPPIAKPVKLSQGITNAAKDKIYEADAVSGLVEHLPDAIAAVSSDPEKALEHLSNAHSAMLVNGEDDAAAYVKEAHDLIAGALGKPTLDQATAAAAGALPAPSGKLPQYIANAVSDHLDKAKKAVPQGNIGITNNIYLAGKALKDDPEAALPYLDHAHSLALANGFDDAADHLEKAHDDIAGALGKPTLKENEATAVALAGKINGPQGTTSEAAIGGEPMPSASAGKLPKDTADAAKKKMYQAAGTASGATVGHIGAAVSAVYGNPEKSLEHLENAHNTAAAAGEDQAATYISQAHSMVATALGKPALSKVVAAATAQTAINHAISASNDGATVVALHDAKDAIKTGDYDSALGHLKTAYDAAGEDPGDGSSTVHDYITVAHDHIATALGKKSLSDAVSEAKTAAAPPKPAVKKLPKAKQDEINGMIASALSHAVNLGDSTAANDLIDAQNLLKAGDLPSVADLMQHAHNSLETFDEGDSALPILATAHEKLAEHLGQKPLQLRTQTHAAEVAPEIAEKVKGVIDSGAYIGTSDAVQYADAAKLEEHLRDGDAAKALLRLRRLDMALKDYLKYAWGDKKAKITATRAELTASVKKLAKLHDADLKNQAIGERANDLAALVAESKPGFSGGYGHGTAATELKAAAEAYDSGNLNHAQVSISTAHAYLKMQKAGFGQQLADEVARLGKALDAEMAVKPAATASDASKPAAIPAGHMAPSRPGAIGASAAEHFMATGGKGSTASVNEYKAQEYKSDVAHRIADEMSHVSTQEIARAALGNRSHNRVSKKITALVADFGTQAIRVEGHDPTQPSSYYKAVSTPAMSHLNDVDEASERLGQSWSTGSSVVTARARVRSLDDGDLAKYGMSAGDIKTLKALAADYSKMYQAPDGEITYGLGGGTPLSDGDRAEMMKPILAEHRNRVHAAVGESLPKVPSVSAEDERHLRSEMVSGLVNLWAASSNDDNIAGLGVQHAAEDEFKIDGAMQWTKSSQEKREEVAAYYRENEKALRGFVRAQYDLTQRELKEAGITHVTLHRGMRWDSQSRVPDWAKFCPPGSYGTTSTVAPGSVVSLKNSDWRPLSSWSHSASQAGSFYSGGTYGTKIKAAIPAERILSTPRTGNGCLSEREWVVLATPGQATVSQSK